MTSKLGLKLFDIFLLCMDAHPYKLLIFLCKLNVISCKAFLLSWKLIVIKGSSISFTPIKNILEFLIIIPIHCGISIFIIYLFLDCHCISYFLGVKFFVFRAAARAHLLHQATISTLSSVAFAHPILASFLTTLYLTHYIFKCYNL